MQSIAVTRSPGRGLLSIVLLCAGLSACGGGGVNSTPVPTPSPTPTPAPTPTPTPTPGTNFNTAEFANSTGPAAHGALTAYQAGASGAGIVIGVIDSGIATGNSEFAGRISPLSRDFAGNATIEDVGGHGTAVSTVVAGARDSNFVLGMAWGATILTLRTDTPGSCAGTGSDDSCSHSDDAIRQAIDYARTSGARVLNISLGGDDAAGPALRAAVARATSAGLILVVAAGNQSSSAPDSFARSIADAGNGLVIIAGSNESNNSYSSFSNGAAGYEQNYMTAIGRRVRSQDQNGTHFLYSGTSFSAPQIVGAIALIQQAFPNLTPTQVVDLLYSTATDGGVAGDDAQFGQGILNLAQAFAPQGAVSLAIGGETVSPLQSSSLSPAMGDAARGQALDAIVLDRLGRAYTMDLASSVTGAPPTMALGPVLRDSARHFSADIGGIAIALSVAPGRPALPMMLTGEDAGAARLLSSRIAARLGKGLTFAMGYGQGSGALVQTISGHAEPAFLVGGLPSAQIGFRTSGVTSAAFAYAPGGPFALSAGVETGKLSVPDRNLPYAAMRLGAQGRTGPATLQLAAIWLRENRTLLGARFTPGLGGGSSDTLFADARLELAPGAGWKLGAAYRRGWTQGAPGGVLTGSARLVSDSWAFDVGKDGIFGSNDSISLRLSQPLRVRSGGLNLTLPVAYDYGSLTATAALRRFNLAPTGRELNAEAVYSRPIGRGWLTANLYWRRQAGNLAWYPQEYAGALRYSLRF